MLNKKRLGFTLIELLVAIALAGMVMGLAMQAFMGMQKTTNITKSRLYAKSEASRAVQEVAALMHRANIIYFTGHPLLNLRLTAALAPAGANAGDALTGSKDPLNAAIPASLFKTTGLWPPMPTVYYQNGNNFDPGTTPGIPISQANFRFYGPGNPSGATTPYLSSNGPTAGGSLTQNCFPSPLAYFAIANFDAAPEAGMNSHDFSNGAATMPDADLPNSWTFYVLYLAPMKIDKTNPDSACSWAWLPGSTKTNPDWVYDTNYTGPGKPYWKRGTLPYELHLLTIKNVNALRSPTLYDHSKRQTDPADNNIILPAPYDLNPTKWGAFGAANYDPLAILSKGTAGSSSTDMLDPTMNVYPTDPTIRPSGERVNSGSGAPWKTNLHPNYNSIGNDPPSDAVFTQAALQSATGVIQPSDRVIVQYVDPDAIEGTCIKLANTIAATVTGAAGTPPPYTNTMWMPSMGLFNASADKENGLFLYNRYEGAGWGGLTWDLSAANNATIPRRAFISITTRYRNNRNVPFQFGTESAEVDLEGVSQYENYDRFNRH